MHKELFGVFGTRRDFLRFRSTEEFDRIVTGENLVVGIRDEGLGIAGQSCAYESSEGCAVIWGEIVSPDASKSAPAKWLFERVQSNGTSAYRRLNGSYIAVVDTPETGTIAPDRLRSRECFFADLGNLRIFGTDAAKIVRCIDSPHLDGIGLNQLLHFGVVFEDHTLVEQLNRLRFDTALSLSDTIDLERIRYRPIRRSRDGHARTLANRLERAIRRRSNTPTPRGILVSAGFDSRAILAMVPDIETSYTIGSHWTPEALTARKLANQYGVDHQLLRATRSYLTTSADVVQYTNGIRESLHIHHRGNMDKIEAATMYHGLLLDTVLRDIYLPGKRLMVFGHPVPLPGLVPRPDLLSFMEERLGIFRSGGRLLGAHPRYASITEQEFLEGTMDNAMESCRKKSDSIHNAMALFGLKVTQALPFKTHLSDHFFESHIAADTGLVEWHLTTPPRHRNARTYLRALRYLDDDLLRHRPPDRPHESHFLNQVEGFARRSVPLVDDPGTPWPDRDALYNQFDLDNQLFPDTPSIHPLPPRIKLRINDAIVWLALATGRTYKPRTILPWV